MYMQHKSIIFCNYSITQSESKFTRKYNVGMEIKQMWMIRHFTVCILVAPSQIGTGKLVNGHR